jgi:hypothetical protein
VVVVRDGLKKNIIIHQRMIIPDELEVELEDTKGAIIIRISKNNRQHNGQKKKYKRTNNDLQNIHIRIAPIQNRPHINQNRSNI